MANKVLLLAGTKKGLFLFTSSDRQRWELDGPFHAGKEVNHAIFVIPLKGAEFRCPPENKLRVFRSRNGGRAREGLANGLPQDNAFVGIYRAGMAVDSLAPAGVYFGTNTGKVFASNDEGDSWYLLVDNLPPVYSIATAVI